MMATTKLSQTYGLKISGKLGSSNFSKTISDVEYDNTFENLDNVEDVCGKMSAVYDSGTFTTFSLTMTEKYEVV